MDIDTIAFATTNGGDLHIETKVYTDADTLIAQHTTTYLTVVKMLTCNGECVVELKNVKL